jgi:transposase
MSVFIGIDVSKATLDIATDCGSQHICIPNTMAGYKRLDKWLQKQGSISQIAMEASGRYGENVAHYLVDKNYAVSYLNPKQIHKFSQMKMHYNKTDKQDARLIAEYCKIFKPDLYQPRSDLQRRLQQRSRRLDQLKKMRQQEINRLKSGISDSFTCQQIETTIAYFDTLIEQTNNAIHDMIMSDENLAQQHQLLNSIKGVGDTTANLILAEINIADFASASQLAAYIGITPQQFQSGTSVNKRASISKQGNARLRAGLYMPAIVAKRWNPPCRNLAQRLEDKQKHGKVIVIAVMRKLVRQIFAILKSGIPFDPNFGKTT